ncbi:MAG: AAA family ATPase, partial [Acutalibacteraceae bacterium]
MKPKLCSRCHQRPAVVFITKVEGDKTTPEGLCLKCAKELNIGPINDMLKKMNISDEDFEAMNDEFMNMVNGFSDESDSDEEGFELGGSATFPFMQHMMTDDEDSDDASLNDDNADSQNKKKEKKDKKGKHATKRKFLNMYCKNLTSEAKEGRIDGIVGRDRELYRVIQILSRRQKNNPCLIGEPGVGKTAIAEGLALKISKGDVPARLLDKEILLLDLTSLVAGTQFRGQFESRIKGLVDEVKAEGNIILFIDEVHNLVGVGDSEGSMNAANILKPALSRGEIQVIGATTFNEYRKYIEKDAALERRFQSVKVEEPSLADAVEIINGIKGYYEKYHNVTVPDSIVRKTVTLSERYITDRFLPDKAIDLLDEACACAALRNKVADRLLVLSRAIGELEEKSEEIEADVDNIDYEELAKVKSELAKNQAENEELLKKNTENFVTDDDLARVIELWTGIPASKVKQSDLKRLSGLEDSIKKKIIGQDEAVREIANAVRRSRVQISARRKPASFIFVGPTGVGKTELVKVLAKELFDTPETLIRLDMSEYMEKHSVSKIIGSPPGYVG